MRSQVQAYVTSRKFQTANPSNPKPPLKLKPLPKIPWHITVVDYKGPIGHQKWYLHTQMDAYSRYPEVHMTKSTGMTELKKVLGRTMRTHGKPKEIWSDGGPPYNGHEWSQWVRSWGSTPKKTTPEHPPANGLVKRFNQELKHVIHAAYAEEKNPKEEVEKFVAAYRNTPHSTKGEKPSKLMRVDTKLPNCDDAILEAKLRGYYRLKLSNRDRGHMLSFRHDGKCGGVRINVYFTTGTVATCLDHPQQGKTQLFRRNMTLGDLKEIFDDPRTHTSKGYHRIPNSGLKYNDDRVLADPSYYYWFQDKDTMNFFKNIFKEGIDSISVGYDCFIILYVDGDTAWSSGLPKHLYNKLNGRQRWLPRPELIALGLRSPSSYYIQFADGDSEWCDLPEDLETAIKESDELVDLITIGDDDEYYVRFKDGSEEWNLPLDLSNLLNGRKGTRRRNPNLAQVKRISLSDQGEWVVGFSDGQWKWSSNNSGNILDGDVTDDMRSCDKIYEFQMGPNSNVVFLYEDN